MIGADDPMTGPNVQALLSDQCSNGGFGVHPYAKWTGAHWRRVSLVELGMPAGEPRGILAAETVLEWLTRGRRLERVESLDGLVRHCASVEGNALAVCCRLGLASDPRVAALAEHMMTLNALRVLVASGRIEPPAAGSRVRPGGSSEALPTP